MQVCEEYEDTITYRMADARDGTNELLARLKYFHDANMVPPFGWTPKVNRPPSEKFWFEPVAEEVKPEPKIAEIKRAASIYFDVSVSDLDSARRTAKVVYPRQVAYFLTKSMTKKSLPEIGRRFGGRDHTTILHSVRKIEGLVKTDWKVAYDVAHVEALL